MFRTVLIAPVFDDEEKTRRAFLLYVILIAMMVGALVYALFVLLFLTEKMMRLAYPTTAILVLGTLLIFLQRGHVRRIALICALFLWALMTIGAFMGGGIYSSAISGFILAVIVAGLLMGVRAGVGLALLSVLSTLGMLYAELNGWTASVFVQTPVSVWTTQTIVFVVTAVFVLLASYSLERAFWQTRSNEQALRESEERFSKAFHASPAAMSISLLDGGAFLDVNRRFLELFGYPYEAVIGRSSLDLGLWKEQTQRPQMLASLKEGQPVHNMEVEFKTVDGKVRVGLLSVDVIELVGRSCMLSMLEDVTERKRAEEAVQRLNAELEDRVAERTVQLENEVAERKQAESDVQQLNQDLQQRAVKLEEANKALESFSYSVSHDLRAPLRAVSGFAEIINLRYQPLLDEEGRRYLNHIVTASKHMDQLINDLLDYSRLGQTAVQQIPVPLESIFRHLSTTLALRVGEAGAQLEIPQTLPVVLGDPTLLEQVFMNLIDNALTYRRNGVKSCIKVSCERAKDQVLVHVSDNGIGIPKAYLDKVFLMFQRLHTQDEYPGTGIGLAIVERTVRLMEGTVSITSAEGQGTTFTVALPEAVQIEL